MSTMPPEIVKQALDKIRVIGDAVKTAGKEGIPSGHLYAMVMDKYSLQEYQMIVNSLTNACVIENKNNLLKFSL
jgi:hypothetical protein